MRQRRRSGVGGGRRVRAMGSAPRGRPALLAMVAVSLAAFLVLAAHQPASANNAMVCTFATGIVKTYENGVFKDEKVEPLTFTIQEIDLARQTAALITPQGRGDLKIVRAIGANHFLEVVTEGFLNMTTVYEAANAGEPMPAVHSRHFGFFGAPFISQYHGTCKPK